MMAKKPNLWVWSADHSGLPLAKRFQEEGHGGGLALIRPERRQGKLVVPKNPKEKKDNQERFDYLNKNGNGVIKKVWAEEALRQVTRKDYCIFDQIYGWQYGEALYKRGVPVLGGAKVGYTLETERLQTLNMLKKMGYDIPPYKSFGPGSSKKGIEFLKGVKDNLLYVFKSDNPAVETYVAHENNDELIIKLTAEHKEIDTDGFLLQEKKPGIELAVETWYYKGKPILANVDLEAKKLYNRRDEPQCGCAFNLLWLLPVNHPLRVRLNAPMDPFVKQHIGTGLMDISVIYDPHDDKMWVLECCGARFAYNAFYTLMALCQMPLGEFFIKYLSGEFKGEIGEKVFGNRFSGSMRMFNHEHSEDQHIHFAEPEYRPHYWLWDYYKKGGDLLTTGGPRGDSIGIVTGTSAENPEGAMANVAEYYDKLYMPKKFGRSDIELDDEINLPLARYHAMKAAKLI